MLSKGPSALSNVELLALLLRSGNRGLSAIDLARRLLQEQGALGGLLAISPHKMARLPGLGPARAASLLAVLELARSAQLEKLDRKAVLGQAAGGQGLPVPAAAGARAQEIFVVLSWTARTA